MSFTDSLSGVESLTSDTYPSSSTVQRVLVSNIGQTVITQNDNAGELAILDSAQEFTTGSNETGYTMSSIDLELTVASTSNFPVVKLFSGSANGTEGCHVDRADNRIYWENHLHLHGAHSHHAGGGHQLLGHG